MSPRELLVVDDEPRIRSFVGPALASVGWAAHEAETCREALAALAEHPGIEIVLLDVRLGASRSGLEVLPRVRVERPGLPVVLTSGDVGEQDEAEALGLGFLAKPFGVAELALAVAQALARHPGPVRVVARAGRGAG